MAPIATAAVDTATARAAKRAARRAARRRVLAGAAATAAGTYAGARGAAESGDIRKRRAVSGWDVVILALLILALTGLEASPSPGVYLALLLFTFMGVLYPPLGLGVGGIIVLYLLIRGGRGAALAAWIDRAIGGQ